MKKIYVSDISLRSFKNAVSFRDRLSIAEKLAAAGLDAVELPFIANLKEDTVVCRTLAAALKNTRVCIPVGSDANGVEAAYNCVKDAASPCLQVVLPISTVQMEYIYHFKRDKMLIKLAELCAKATELCDCVELVAQDASRAEEGFLAECCRVAEEKGVSAVTVCDDSGVYFPEDIARAVSEVKAACSMKVYVCPSNALGLAAACATEAIKAGADGVKTAALGDGLSPALLADIFRVKSDELDAEVGLDITAIHNILGSVSVTEEMSSEKESAYSEKSVFDKSCTLSDICAAVKELGYELSDSDNGRVFEEFSRVIAKKESIGERELEAIVASSAMHVPSAFHVTSYVINSGNIIAATANICLEKNGVALSGVSTGDGPIDAAFHAIEQIVGHKYELDDFQIESVTKGRESLGSALIRLRANGKLYSGNGVSTDIIGACIRAYINALNKIVYEEQI